MWAIVVACVVVIAAAGVTIWLATRGGDGSGGDGADDWSYSTPAATVEPSVQPSTEPTPADTLSPPADLAYLCAAQATSTLPADDGITYEAGNAVDGKKRTCWAEGSPGYGVGETIRFDFPETMVIAWINVLPGYYKYSTGWDRWWTNGRLRTVRLTWSDGSSVTRSFMDEKGWQRIDPGSGTWTTDWIEMTILRVYPADTSHPNAASDTSLSEIQFVGWPYAEAGEQ
jgi:hypothetical protein